MSTQTVTLAMKAGPEEIWDALSDGAVSPVCHYGLAVETDELTEGAGYRCTRRWSRDDHGRDRRLTGEPPPATVPSPEVTIQELGEGGRDGTCPQVARGQRPVR